MTFTDIIKKVLRDLELTEPQIEKLYGNAMAKTPIQDYEVPQDQLVTVENWIRAFMAEHLLLMAQDPGEFERRAALYEDRARKINELN